MADDVVEDLAQGEQDGGSDEVDHGPRLSEDPQDEDGLEDEEDDEEDEGGELVQDVEGDVAVRGGYVGRVPVVCPPETGVEGDVAGADEQGGGRDENEPQGDGRPVVEYLVADQRVQQEDPGRCNDEAEVYAGEGLLSTRVSRGGQSPGEGRWVDDVRCELWPSGGSRQR